jgi:hypothetical protein
MRVNLPRRANRHDASRRITIALGVSLVASVGCYRRSHDKESSNDKKAEQVLSDEARGPGAGRSSDHRVAGARNQARTASPVVKPYRRVLDSRDQISKPWLPSRSCSKLFGPVGGGRSCDV